LPRITSKSFVDILPGASIVDEVDTSHLVAERGHHSAKARPITFSNFPDLDFLYKFHLRQPAKLNLPPFHPNTQPQTPLPDRAQGRVQWKEDSHWEAPPTTLAINPGKPTIATTSLNKVGVRAELLISWGTHGLFPFFFEKSGWATDDIQKRREMLNHCALIVT
jgi:hypothetical protein